METVLVTGGNGVIGSWASRELIRRGARVVVADLLEAPAVRFPELDAREVVAGDLRDDALLRQVIVRHEVTTVLHLAAVVGESAERDPARAIEVNGVVTARLLEAARGLGLRRLVATSTKGVLGPLDPRYLHPTYEPVPVDLPPSPRSVYESSKYLVEVLVRRYRELGVSAAAVRLATTWGPGKTGETHAGFSLHSDVVARAMRGESTELDVHPSQGYDLVYYGDVAAGLADACLTERDLRSPVYHLGSGVVATMAEFAESVMRAFPGVRVGLGDRLAPGRNCLLDIERSRADLGYRPLYPLPAALEDYRSVAGLAAFSPSGSQDAIRRTGARSGG